MNIQAKYLFYYELAFFSLNVFKQVDAFSLTHNAIQLPANNGANGNIDI